MDGHRIESYNRLSFLFTATGSMLQNIVIINFFLERGRIII